ncbi:hypothetical protein [Tenacibaculum sp. UWU-22]|uniref:hypothetical protein n=1 Tax=Tenacibaculum sp. UWU-22 TaxID=3234187 RepID=UPI0034DAE453
MKYCFLILFCISCVCFSQQTVVRSFTSDKKEIEITTDGLDQIIIANSDSDKVVIQLFDENPNSHYIDINEESSFLKIEFKSQFIQEEGVFKKFITKRLNRVWAVIELPKNKKIEILGTNVNVVSKSYNGSLKIFIDKGNVRLNKVQNNAEVSLFQGNVFAQILSNTNQDIKTNNGIIEVDKQKKNSPYKTKKLYSVNSFTVNSINANVFLTETPN